VPFGDFDDALCDSDFVHRLPRLLPFSYRDLGQGEPAHYTSNPKGFSIKMAM
jgi:hypothetical protein